MKKKYFLAEEKEGLQRDSVAWGRDEGKIQVLEGEGLRRRGDEAERVECVFCKAGVTFCWEGYRTMGGRPKETGP